MKTPVSFKFALRFLFSKGSDTFSSYASLLAIGGLSIGVSSLMLTASIINGFHDTISDKLSSFEGDGRLGHILGKSICINDADIDSLVNYTPGEVSPFINGVALLRFGSKAEGVIIEGVDAPPNSISNIEKINDGNIIIGKGLASSLNIKVNDKIYLQGLSSDEPLSNFPKIRSFTVSDIFYSGLQEYDKSLTYISLYDARSVLALEETDVSGLIFNNEEKNPPTMLDVNYPYYYETWKQKHALLFEWISLQQWPAYLMFGLIALVGLVNLIAAITMIIIEKTKQIGILLAQGTSKSFLRDIFIIQGGFIGLIGGLIGGVLSIFIIMIQLKYRILEIPSDIYFMDQIPVSFDYIIFSVILMLSFILSLLASWFPVRNLSDLKPSDALRYE